MKASFDNPRGFFENNKIVALNTEILNQLNASWDKPFFDQDKLENPILYNFFLSKLRKIINQEFNNATCLLIKDPRISILFSLWDRALKELRFADIKVVVSLRNPASIADSLLKRNGILPNQSHFLNLEYLAKADQGSMYLERHFFDFDNAIMYPGKEQASLLGFLGQNTCVKNKSNIEDRIDKSIFHDLKETGPHPVFRVHLSLIHISEPTRPY